MREAPTGPATSTTLLEQRRLECLVDGFCADLSMAGGQTPPRLLWRGNGLALLVDRSPLCEGHLLLVTEDHDLSFADANLSHDQRTAIEAIRRRYIDFYGQLAIIEHGSGRAESPEQPLRRSCIVHAHWHLFPASADNALKVAEEVGPKATLDGLDELRQYADEPYILIWTDSRLSIHRIEVTPPRQFARQTLASTLNIPAPEWDWAISQNQSTFESIIAQHRAAATFSSLSHDNGTGS